MDKEKTSNKKWYWILGIGVIIILILSGASSGSSVSSPAQNSNNGVSVGENGVLNNNGSTSDCEGIVSIALSEEAFDDLTNASVAKDSYGYQQVFSEGRAVTVENCTEVKVLDVKFAKRKVRALSQPEISGWVPAEWVLSQ